MWIPSQSYMNTLRLCIRRISIRSGMTQRKVAILSQSMPNWSVAFFATVSFGRISIPILPEITGPRMFQSPDGLLLILSVRSHGTQESCLGNPCEVFMRAAIKPSFASLTSVHCHFCRLESKLSASETPMSSPFGKA